MRARLAGALTAAALILGAGAFYGHATALAAGPEKKPAATKDNGKGAKPAATNSNAAPNKNAKTAPPTGDNLSEEEIIVDEGDIAIGEMDAIENEGPSVAGRPRERVNTTIDLSAPMTAEPSGPPVNFALSVRLGPDLPPLASGAVWRIFGEREGGDARLPLLNELAGGVVQLKLSPGSYLVHVAYGRAGATKRIVVPPTGGKDEFVLNAGGLRLGALVGKDSPVSTNQLSFDVYIDDGDDGERTLVVSRVPAKRVLRLHAGTYYVVSRYGDANAMVRAAIKVEAGKLTDATLFHQAARVTLKLVSERGGEALANTQWSVQKPGGEPVAESVGAYHQAILAAGQYQAVARHDGKTFRSTFVVENDLNRDVEVIAK